MILSQRNAARYYKIAGYYHNIPKGVGADREEQDRLLCVRNFSPALPAMVGHEETRYTPAGTEGKHSPAPYAKKAEIRLYENSVDEELGVYNEDGSLNLNPNSLTILKECYVEPALADAKAYDSFQFVRQGYFCVDAKDSKEDALVFNRIVSLKSSYKLPTQTK